MADGVWKFFEPMRKDHLTVGKYDQYGKDLLDTDLFFGATVQFRPGGARDTRLHVDWRLVRT
jgi:hypothetical protein